jgi:hypothetical protein
MKINRDKVKEILKSCDKGLNEKHVCLEHDITIGTYLRRCRPGIKNGWTQEQLIALGATLGKMQGKRPIPFEDLIIIGEPTTDTEETEQQPEAV